LYAIFSLGEVVRVERDEQEIKEPANDRTETVDGCFFSQLENAIEHGGGGGRGQLFPPSLTSMMGISSFTWYT
jgi:hypothetical protein